MLRRLPLFSLWALAFLTASWAFQVAAGSASTLFAGFAHTPLGTAVLTLAGGRLEVASLAFGDGVRVETVAAEGLASRLGFEDIDFPPDTRLTASASGPVSDLGTVVAARLDIERTQEDYVLTPSFPGLGGPSYRLELYLSGEQVFALDSPMPVGGTIVWPGGMEPELFVHRGGALALHGFPDMSAGGGFRPPGGEVIDADSVVFLAQGAMVDADALEALEIVVDGVAAFHLDGHDLVAWNARHRALGGRLVPGIDSLTLEAPSTRGVGGLGGVEVELGEALGWWIAAEGLSPSDLPTGAFVEAQTLGVVDGVADQEVVATRLDDTGSELVASFVFSPLFDSPTEARYTAQVLLNGDVVDSKSGLLGPAARFAAEPAILDPLFPDPFPADPFPLGELSARHRLLPLLTLTFDSPELIFLTGATPPVFGDEIRAKADGQPRSVGSASRLRITTSGVSSLILRTQTVAKVEKPYADLSSGVETWAFNCLDEVRPEQVVYSFVCTVNSGSSTFQGRVCGDPPVGLTYVEGLNMARQMDQSWKSGSISLPPGRHCAVGLKGKVASASLQTVSTQFTVTTNGMVAVLADVDNVVPGSQPPPMQAAVVPAIPAVCKALCQDPMSHQCDDEEEIFSNGFETADCSKWTSSTGGC